MHTQKLFDALLDVIRAEISAELDRRAAAGAAGAAGAAVREGTRAENPAKTTEQPDERQTVEAERGADQELGRLAQAELAADQELGRLAQAELAADREARAAREEARLTRDPIVPLDGRGPEPTDKDRAALTAALKALIVEQNDAAVEFRHLVREGKQRACSACYDWSDFECVVDFINYRRGLKNGRA